MRAMFTVVVALSVVSCKKEPIGDAASTPSPRAPASTAEQDALWAFAPEGTLVGLVASPRAFSLVERGYLAIHELIATAPELAQLGAAIDRGIHETFGTTRLSAVEVGLTTRKGLAVFKTAEGSVAIIPVADRDKYLAATKGTKGAAGDTIDDATCKTVQGVYACGAPASMLDKLGKRGMPAATKLVGARGDIEIAGMFPGPSPMPFAVVAQLDHGAVVVRAAVKGLGALIPMRLVEKAKPRASSEHTVGFAVMDLGSLLPSVPAVPLVPGVNADALVQTIAGPATLSSEAGTPHIDLRIPLSDRVLAQKLVEQCDHVPPLQRMGATVKDGVCHVALPQMLMELDIWVEAKELRIGKKDAAASNVRAPMSAAGAELAAGEWALALFGRGSLLATPKLPPMPLGDVPDMAKAMIRSFALLNELGVGVRMDGDTLRVLATIRTAFANPDDVVRKLVAIAPDDIIASTTYDTAKAIANGAPRSPFAADFAAGWSGLMIPTAALGMMASVAIPAFMQYMKKSKSSEASLQLSRIEKTLGVLHATTGQLPIGRSPVTTTCCSDHGTKCSDPTIWNDPIWRQLEFALDEPSPYRYEYASSDGKSFIVRAIADLDCDGIESSWVLVGTATPDGITATIEAPEPGKD